MKNSITSVLVGLLVSSLGASSVNAGPTFQGKKLWHEKSGANSKSVVGLPSLAPLVDKVGSAVLTISVTSTGPTQDPRMKMFRMQTPQQPMEGQGSGFLIHEDGYALTNYHVVENATDIRVRLGGKSPEYQATIVGTDPSTDVALIRLTGKKRWPFIPLGDSEALHVGDFVVAIGNPFGLSQTVSTGIISAEHRRDIAPSGRQGLYDFLQTDASINPGNSGGPLINLRGEAIGINAAVNQAGQGLGFAIPINLVKKLIPQLKQSGTVARSYIGTRIQEVTPEIAAGLGMKSPRGALIISTEPGSPAESAGIQPGDVIVRFNDKQVERSSDLPLLTAHAGVGKSVQIGVFRDGKTRDVRLKLAAAPGTNPTVPTPKKKTKKNAANDTQFDDSLGLRFTTLGKRERKALKLGAKISGALVLESTPGKPAYRNGFAKGDVITELNRKRIRSAADLHQALKGVPKGKLLRIIVIRGRSKMFVPMVRP